MYVQRRKRRQLWAGPYHGASSPARQSASGWLESNSPVVSESEITGSRSEADITDQDSSTSTTATSSPARSGPISARSIDFADTSAIMHARYLDRELQAAATSPRGHGRSILLSPSNRYTSAGPKLQEIPESQAFPGFTSASGLFQFTPSFHQAAAAAGLSQELLPFSMGYRSRETKSSGSGSGCSSHRDSNTCRFCGTQFSTSSNRHRHERVKHSAELNTLSAVGPTPGNSRKSSGEQAFASSPRPTHETQLQLEDHETELADVHEGQTIAQDPESSPDQVRQAVGSGIGEANQAPQMLVDSDLAAVATLAAGFDADSADVPSQGVAMELDREVEPGASPDQHDPDPVKGLDDCETQPATVAAASGESEFNGELPSESAASLGVSQAVDPEQPWPLTADSLLQLEGARPLLQEEDLQSVCYPFLQWLANPPITQVEALVKARRVKTMSQLQPIKSNLRFIFALLYESKVMDNIQLTLLTQLSVCQALYRSIVDRQSGSGRMHAIFLLVKKVLVYLSSVDSAKSRQFVQPTAYESYLYVESICSDSSNQRKTEARNRIVLGMPGSHGALAPPREQFQIPKTWTSCASDRAAAAAKLPKQVQTPPSAPAQRQGADPSVMSKQEFQQVTQACLSYLATQMLEWSRGIGTTAAAMDADLAFTHYLVTATLCLGLAPRSQVLQQLRIGSSFTKSADDGRYWIKLLAEQSKNGKPTMFALAAELTAAYDAYLQVVRPRLIARFGVAAASTSRDHDYVFMKRNGAVPRTDFSSSTCLVTQRIIGRPINAHAFRSSVITTFYSSGASQADMDMLANIMAHDPATARNFYYKPQHSQAAVQTSQRMVAQLLAPPAHNSSQHMIRLY